MNTETSNERYNHDGCWVFKFPFRVAFGRSSYSDEPQQTCPIWGDKLDYKDATHVVPDHLYWHAIESITGVQGGMPTRIEQLPDGRWAMRSEYQAW